MSEMNQEPRRLQPALPGIHPEITQMHPNHPFRAWCQKVLPLTYDDSLSYYELLNKVVYYLNMVLREVNDLSHDVIELYKALLDLQDQMDEKIIYALDQMAEDGTLANVIEQYLIAWTRYPLFDGKHTATMQTWRNLPGIQSPFPSVEGVDAVEKNIYDNVGHEIEMWDVNDYANGTGITMTRDCFSGNKVGLTSELPTDYFRVGMIILLGPNDINKDNWTYVGKATEYTVDTDGVPYITVDMWLDREGNEVTPTSFEYVWINPATRFFVSHESVHIDGVDTGFEGVTGYRTDIYEGKEAEGSITGFEAHLHGDRDTGIAFHSNSEDNSAWETVVKSEGNKSDHILDVENDTDTTIINNGVVSTDFIQNEGNIGNDFIENNGTIGNDFIENSGSIGTDFVKNTGNVKSDILDNAGTVTNDVINNSGVVNNDFVGNTGKVSDNFVENSGDIGTNFVKNTGEVTKDFINNTGNIGNDFINNFGDIDNDFVENTGKVSGNLIYNYGSVTGDIIHNEGSSANTINSTEAPLTDVLQIEGNDWLTGERVSRMNRWAVRTTTAQTMSSREDYGTNNIISISGGHDSFSATLGNWEGDRTGQSNVLINNNDNKLKVTISGATLVDGSSTFTMRANSAIMIDFISDSLYSVVGITDEYLQFIYDAIQQVYVTLDTKIEKEIEDRTNADIALQTEIDQEIQDRKDADERLYVYIDKQDATEKAEREAADEKLQDNIDAETKAREEGDNTLQSEIDQEIQDRENADERLRDYIDKQDEAEKEERESKDKELEDMINNETSGTMLWNSAVKLTTSTTTADTTISTIKLSELLNNVIENSPSYDVQPTYTIESEDKIVNKGIIIPIETFNEDINDLTLVVDTNRIDINGEQIPFSVMYNNFFVADYSATLRSNTYLTLPKEYHHFIQFIINANTYYGTYPSGEIDMNYSLVHIYSVPCVPTTDNLQDEIDEINNLLIQPAVFTWNLAGNKTGSTLSLSTVISTITNRLHHRVTLNTGTTESASKSYNFVITTQQGIDSASIINDFATSNDEKSATKAVYVNGKFMEPSDVITFSGDKQFYCTYLTGISESYYEGNGVTSKTTMSTLHISYNDSEYTMAELAERDNDVEGDVYNIINMVSLNYDNAFTNYGGTKLSNSFGRNSLSSTTGINSPAYFKDQGYTVQDFVDNVSVPNNDIGYVALNGYVQHNDFYNTGLRFLKAPLTSNGVIYDKNGEYLTISSPIITGNYFDYDNGIRQLTLHVNADHLFNVYVLGGLFHGSSVLGNMPNAEGSNIGSPFAHSELSSLWRACMAFYIKDMPSEIINSTLTQQTPSVWNLGMYLPNGNTRFTSDTYDASTVITLGNTNTGETTILQYPPLTWDVQLSHTIVGNWLFIFPNSISDGFNQGAAANLAKWGEYATIDGTNYNVTTDYAPVVACRDRLAVEFTLDVTGKI